MADDNNNNKNEETPAQPAAAEASTEEPKQEHSRPGAVRVTSAAPRGKRDSSTVQKDANIAADVTNDGTRGAEDTEMEPDQMNMVAPPAKEQEDTIEAELNSSANIQPMEPADLHTPAAEPSTDVTGRSASNSTSSAATSRARQSRRADAKTALREEMNSLRSQGVSQQPGAVPVTTSAGTGTANASANGGDAEASIGGEAEASRNQATAPDASKSTKAAIKQEMNSLRNNAAMNRPGSHSLSSSTNSASAKGSTRATRPSRRITTRQTSGGDDDDRVKGAAKSRGPPPVRPGATSETSKSSEKSAEILKAGGPMDGNATPEKNKVAIDKSKTGAVSTTSDEKNKTLKGDDAMVTSSPPPESSMKKMEMSVQEKHREDSGYGAVAAGIPESSKSLEASLSSIGKEGALAHVGINEEGLVAAQVIDEEELEAQYQEKMMKDVVAAEVVSDDELREKGRCWKISSCCLLLIGIVLAIAIPLSKDEEIPADPPTASPTEQSEYELLVDLLLPYSGSALGNNATPQFQALEWLAFEDPIDLSIKGANETTLLERYAAAVLYFSCDGGNWRGDLNFLSNKSVCEWHDASDSNGLFCNGEIGENVRRMEFSNTGINGTIPTEIMAFSQLGVISFLYEGLYGTLPSDLGDMTSLTYLQVVDNALTGTIPNSFERLPLDLLNVNLNLLSGTVPSTLLSYHDQMYALVLADNLFEGPLPEMNRRSAMMYAFLDRNFFDGKIPLSYFSQNNLVTLSLPDNQLTGPIPEQIRALPSLVKFYAQGNALSGTIPSSVSELGDLQEFLIGENNLTGSIPSQLGRLASLARLDLSENGITGPLPSELGNLDTITFLDISSNQFSGTLPLTFSELTALSTFDLSDTDIVGGLEEAFCERSIFSTSISSDCGGDNATISCSCCSTCCNGANECELNLFETCEIQSAVFELAPDRGTSCECVDAGSRMSCVDTACESCNPEKTICARSTDYGHTLNETTGEIISFRNVLQYTKGRNDTVLFSKDADELTCDVEVNGEKCQQCSLSVCGVQGIMVECNNLPDGPIVNTCKAKSESSYLEVFWMFDIGLLSGCPPMIVDLLPGND